MKEKMENGKEMKTAAVLAATAFAVMAALVAQQAVWAAWQGKHVKPSYCVRQQDSTKYSSKR